MPIMSDTWIREMASRGTGGPAKIYAKEGARQFLFLEGDKPCEVSYADRAGKYMRRTGVTLPRL